MRYWWVNDRSYTRYSFINFGYKSYENNKNKGVEEPKKGDLFLKYRSSSHSGDLQIQRKTIYAVGIFNDNDIVHFDSTTDQRNVSIKLLDTPYIIDNSTKSEINSIQGSCNHKLFKEFKFDKNNNIPNGFIFELCKTLLI